MMIVLLSLVAPSQGTGEGVAVHVAINPAVPSAGGPRQPTALAFANTTTGCVGGRYLILCTTNEGHSWQDRYKGADILQLAFTDQARGWAVAPSLLLVTNDGGRSWHRRSLLPGLSAVDFLNRSDGWAITGHGLFVTHNGGQTWAQGGIAQVMKAVSFADPQHGWCLGADDTVYATTDGGRLWTRQWQAIVGADWQGTDNGQLRFTDVHTGWLLLTLQVGCGSQAPYILYHTSDGGRRWVPALVTSAACRGGHYPAVPTTLGPTGYVGGMDVMGARVWLSVQAPAVKRGEVDVTVTYDDGRTWTYTNPVVGDATEAITTVAFVTGRVGWVVTGHEPRAPLGGRIFHTTNGGHSWIYQFG